MSRIRIPFSIEAWIKDKSQKIVTRGGQKAHYVGEDSAGWWVFEVDQRFLSYHHSHLYNGPDAGPNDLFILPAAPKLTPFEEAVKELCWRIGMGEVIKEEEQIIKVAAELMERAKEEKSVGIEFTDFERAVKRGFLCAGCDASDGIVKDTASELLIEARRAWMKEPYTLLDDLNDYILPRIIEAREQGRRMAEEIMPKWENCECNGVGSQRYTIVSIVSGPSMDAKNEYILDTIGQKRIFLRQLEKLPITGVAICGSRSCGMVEGE